MPQQPFDIGSKFLVQKQARALLLLGGAKGVRSAHAMQAELVRQRKLPDGLLKVYFEKQKHPDHVLVEVATYPERRALDQALDDLTLARSYLKGVLPDLLMLVLCPKGKFRITGRHEIESRLGWSRLACGWRVVELWTLSAEELLTAADVGVIPFVPLARYDGPPEELLERCRDRIESELRGDDRNDLLGVSTALAGLKFPQRELLDLLGGSEVMIESPVLQSMRAETMRKAILSFLKGRFGKVPSDVRRLLSAISDERKLERLAAEAGGSESMEAFKERLLN